MSISIGTYQSKLHVKLHVNTVTLVAIKALELWKWRYNGFRFVCHVTLQDHKIKVIYDFLAKNLSW